MFKKLTVDDEDEGYDNVFILLNMSLNTLLPRNRRFVSKILSSLK